MIINIIICWWIVIFTISWSCMRPGEIALLKIYHLSLSSLTGPLSRACMSMRLHGKWQATPNSKSGILCDTVVLNHTSKIWWMNLKNHLLCLQYKQTLNCSCKTWDYHYKPLILWPIVLTTLLFGGMQRGYRVLGQRGIHLFHYWRWPLQVHYGLILYYLVMIATRLYITYCVT